MDDYRLSTATEVVLADKNPLVLSAISELVVRDARCSLTATVSTSERFLETLGRTRVHVGVIGWILPKLGGVRLLEAVRDGPEPPRMIVYTGSDDPDLPRKAMAAGAAGFCSKNEPPERLLEVIAGVARGQMVFPFLDVRSLHQDRTHGLTPRERLLLAALARGRTNAELARDTGISVNTVKFHLRNLYEKLALRNRAEAVAFWYASNDGLPREG